MKRHLQFGLQLLGGLPNAGAQRVEIGSDLLGQKHGNCALMAELQITGSEIRSIAQPLRDSHNFGARLGVDASTPMQRSIHCPNRNASRLRNFFDTGKLKVGRMFTGK